MSCEGSYIKNPRKCRSTNASSTDYLLENVPMIIAHKILIYTSGFAQDVHRIFVVIVVTLTKKL